MTKKFILLLSLVALLSSCASNKKVIYFNGADGAQNSSLEYQNTFQPDDKLMITVTAENPDLANDFNLLYVNNTSIDMRTMINDDAFYTYLVDQSGEISFPKLGKIKVAGLTRIQTEEKIKEMLLSEIKNPGVMVRLMNFEVSVLGEVARPGAFRVTGERITLLEALSLAGDLTIYGKREDVSIVREKDGVRTIAHVDLTNADFMNSPYYYLAHNDQVYVKPNKTRVNSSVIGPNLTVAISALSLLVTIIALSTR